MRKLALIILTVVTLVLSTSTAYADDSHRRNRGRDHAEDGYHREWEVRHEPEYRHEPEQRHEPEYRHHEPEYEYRIPVYQPYYENPGLLYEYNKRHDDYYVGWNDYSQNDSYGVISYQTEEYPYTNYVVWEY